MNEVNRVDDLASIDTTPDPEPWLRMLRGMWPGDARKQARYRRLFGMLGLRRGGRVLEVGCGAGGAARFLAECVDWSAMVVGTDPSRLAVAEAARLTRPNGRQRQIDPVFLTMDGRQMGFANGAFDGVFCTRVLIHAPEPKVILTEMVRVLRPGGRILLVEPDRDGMLSSAEADHVNRIFWSDRRSVNPQIGRRLYPLLRELGLEVEHVEPSFNVSLQPPVDDQVRLLERELAAERGEWWELIQAGRITRDELRTYVESMRSACVSGVYLRCDLELAYVARKATL